MSHPPLLVPQRTLRLRLPSADISERPMVAAVSAVSPGYLATLDLIPLQGRDFTSRDADPRGGRTAIVSETTARRLLPATNPLGQRLVVGGSAEVICQPLVRS
jgi:MacB-like periplasmic core domain